MQTFWKLVEIWQSYIEYKGGNFFETQCSWLFCGAALHYITRVYCEASHLPSIRQHLSYDDCLEDKSEDYQNCSVLYCVTQLCTIICTLILTVVTDELFTQCRSVAKNVGCFRRNLFFLFVCVCQHDNFRMSKHRMMKLGGRCIVQISRPSSNLRVIVPGVCTPENVAFGYHVGKISAGRLV